MGWSWLIWINPPGPKDLSFRIMFAEGIPVLAKDFSQS
jgi:hypothetical protein